MIKQLRNFVATHNNYTHEDLAKWDSFPCRYLVYAKEKAPTTGTPHLQIYCELENKIAFNTLKELFPGLHLKPRSGSQQDAINYIKYPEKTKSGKEKGKEKPKPEDLYERGEPKRQGARSDFTLAKQLLENGISIQEAIDEHDDEITIGTIKAYEKLQKYISCCRTRSKPDVYWIYGPGGVGKTYRAYQLAGTDSVFKLDLFDKGWYDGYDRHKTIIIDDFYCDEDDTKLFKEVLQLTDKYSFQGNVKGSSVWISPERIIFTSQRAPWEIWRPKESRYKEEPGPAMFDRDERLRQLMRRIKEVIHIKGERVTLNYPVLTEEE